MPRLRGWGESGAPGWVAAMGEPTPSPPAAQPAPSAGWPPPPRQSGTSIHSQRQARRGNRTVKNVFFHAAMVSILNDPTSKAYYQRKRDEGKRHSSALVALARRKVTVLHAMLRTRTAYQRPPDHELEGRRGS